jgi:hypothetical protein
VGGVVTWDTVALTVITSALSVLVGWLLATVRDQAHRADEERTALYNGVRALLRSEIMRTHHQAVADGFAATMDKEVMQRSYDAYHALGGNGIATNLYKEMLELPTRESMEGNNEPHSVNR